MDDAISRQAAIDLAKDICVPTKDGSIYRHRCIDPDAIRELPSVQPEWETGEWIKKVRKSYPWYEYTGHDVDGNIHTISFQKEETTTTYRCSKCGFVVWDFEENYCPDCGRKMKKNENKETDSK